MEESRDQPARADAQLLYGAFKASPFGIALENLEGQPLFVNPALCSLLGFSEEEMRRKHCVDFSPREDAEKDWAFFEQMRAGSIDHYDIEKRFFRRDGSLVWGRLSISLLKDSTPPMVVAVVEDITERKLAEEVRARHTAIVESSEDAIICENLDGIILAWNAAAQLIFGYMEAEAVGQPITILIPPKLQDEETKILEKLRAGERIEHYEAIRVTKTGQKINVSLSISAIKDATGRVVGACKIVRDITQHKEALSKVSQKLIQAQEQERSRLARELHDDISQRLAMLVVRLEGLKQNLPTSADQLERDIGDASEEIAGLAKDIQALSHRLHSPKLELLGLAAAASSFCKEFSNRQNVEIDLQVENIPEDLTDATSLCLYRILQEALQNAAKHSNSRQFQVSLRGGTSEIELTVRDSGVGFDLDEAMKGEGLGLTSMREQMKLVDGELLIESHLQRGTTIHARVPLSPKTSSAKAGE